MNTHIWNKTPFSDVKELLFKESIPQNIKPSNLHGPLGAHGNAWELSGAKGPMGPYGPIWAHWAPRAPRAPRAPWATGVGDHAPSAQGAVRNCAQKPLFRN